MLHKSVISKDSVLGFGWEHHKVMAGQSGGVANS
jgi:hypothetical protein